MTKSSAGLALDRTGRANVIAVSANFRCTSVADGEAAAWVICSLAPSSVRRNAWDCGNCCHAFFHSMRPAAHSAENMASVRSVLYEKHARLDGRWLDVVIVERLIATNVNGVSS